MKQRLLKKVTKKASSSVFSGVLVRTKTNKKYAFSNENALARTGGNIENASERKNISLRFGLHETDAFSSTLVWLGP